MAPGTLTQGIPHYKTLLWPVIIFLVIYFIWMDIALYVHLQQWSPPEIITNKTTTVKSTAIGNTETVGVFNQLSVKLIMVDHWTHYVHDIIGRFLIDYLKLAQIFYWMSANHVSFVGLFAGFIGSLLTTSDYLIHRQIGALLFECRNVADSLDGVFARARKREHAELMRKNNALSRADQVVYESTYGTVGYNVDVICDVFGGAFLCLAILYRFLRRPPQKPNQLTKLPTNYDLKYTKLVNEDAPDYPEIKVNNNASDKDTTEFKARNSSVSDSVKEAFLSSSTTDQAYSSRNSYSHREVKIIILSFGMRVLVTGFLWDHFVHKYHALLMVYSENPTQRRLQGEAFRSISTWLIMWLWRIANGCALLEHLAFSTFFDRIWEYIVLTKYFGWGYLLILSMFTQIHYFELYQSLNKASAFI